MEHQQKVDLVLIAQLGCGCGAVAVTAMFVLLMLFTIVALFLKKVTRRKRRASFTAKELHILEIGVEDTCRAIENSDVLVFPALVCHSFYGHRFEFLFD